MRFVAILVIISAALVRLEAQGQRGSISGRVTDPDGETLVVDIVGFHDRSWLDFDYPHTEMLHVVTRYRRTDFGPSGRADHGRRSGYLG